MATSGSITTGYYHANNGTMGVKLSWSLKSQSIENNTSTIGWTVQSVGTYPKDSWIYCYSLVVTLNGTKIVNKTSRFEMKGNGGYKTTGTMTIAHTADGTKTFSMSIKAAIYSSSVNCKASGSGTPDTINRYALISTYGNFTDEENPTITYINPAGGDLTSHIKARLKWTNNSTEITTDWSPELSDEGGTYTFDLDSYRGALRSACPNSNTLAVTYDVISTMGGTDYHDTKTATMNIVNANPTIASNTITYLDTDSATVAKTGNNNQIIVQGQGVLQISIDTTKISSQKSSTISDYTLQFNNTTYALTTSGNIKYANISQPDVAGSVPTTLTVTDSRGNTSLHTIYVPVFELSAPSANYTLVRENNFDTPTTLTVNALYSSINGTNSLTIKEKHKQVGSSTWSNETTVTNNTPIVLQLTKEYDYDVQLTLYDEYYTSDDQTAVYHKTIYTTVVSKGTPLMFFDKKRHSVGVNDYPDEDEQFYVDGTVKFERIKKLKSEELWSGSMTSGEITFPYANWNYFIIFVREGTSNIFGGRVIPASKITNTAVSYMDTNANYYFSYQLSHNLINNVDMVTLKFQGRSSGSNLNLTAVYGGN